MRPGIWAFDDGEGVFVGGVEGHFANGTICLFDHRDLVSGYEDVLNWLEELNEGCFSGISNDWSSGNVEFDLRNIGFSCFVFLIVFFQNFIEVELSL